MAARKPSSEFLGGPLFRRAILLAKPSLDLFGDPRRRSRPIDLLGTDASPAVTSAIDGKWVARHFKPSTAEGAMIVQCSILTWWPRRSVFHSAGVRYGSEADFGPTDTRALKEALSRDPAASRRCATVRRRPTRPKRRVDTHQCRRGALGGPPTLSLPGVHTQAATTGVRRCAKVLLGSCGVADENTPRSWVRSKVGIQPWDITPFELYPRMMAVRYAVPRFPPKLHR